MSVGVFLAWDGRVQTHCSDVNPYSHLQRGYNSAVCLQFADLHCCPKLDILVCERHSNTLLHAGFVVLSTTRYISICAASVDAGLY